MNNISISDIKQQFELSHDALMKSLIGLNVSEAFEGSEWSVADVLMHMAILADLDEELLDNKVTEYNPENNYPALSLRDLLDRMSRHELNHAHQIEQIIVKLRNKG